MKDARNKAAHAISAQLACEAAGAIRTVSSLTREEDCLKQYSNSLDEALERSNKAALWSNLILHLLSPHLTGQLLLFSGMVPGLFLGWKQQPLPFLPLSWFVCTAGDWMILFDL